MRRLLVLPPILLGLAAALLTLQPDAQQQQGGEAFVVALDEKGGFAVGYEGETIITGSYACWGPNWAWHGFNVAPVKSEPNEFVFDGQFEHEGKKILVRGSLRLEPPNRLVLSYTPRSADEFDLIGLAMELQFDLRSLPYEKAVHYTSRDGARIEVGFPPTKLREPIWTDDPAFADVRELSAWEWRIGGRTIKAEMSRPIACIPLDRRSATNEHSYAIRHFFVSGRMTRNAEPLVVTLTFPAGTVLGQPIGESFDPDNDWADWFPDALGWEDSPVDLSFLNEPEKPAGKHGFLTVRGGKFVFEDGTPVRFWAANVAAYAIYCEDKREIDRAARRISKLGYNLVRLHHQDSAWVSPRVFDQDANDTQTYDAAFWDSMDYWIYCLKREGIYVHMDIHVGRTFKEGDQIPGFEEMTDRGRRGEGKGYCFFNTRVQELMKQYQEYLWRHVNPYTKLAYKDDPAIALALISNENDLTTHFGNLMLGDKGNPYHNKIFQAEVDEYAQRHGLDKDRAWRTWEPGPSKLFLNDKQAWFFGMMRDHLRELGVRIPVTGTNWCYALYDLPAMATMDFMDTHAYGGGEPLKANPAYEASYIDHIALARVAGKPFVVSEWNVTVPNPFRVTTQLEMAATACHQGWDGAYMYNYWQGRLGRPDRTPQWGSAYDPALAGMAIPAALMYRRGDVARGQKTVAITCSRDNIYNQANNEHKMAALRSGIRKHAMLIALESVPEGVEVDERVSPDRSFLEQGADAATTDTGEVSRNWKQGVMTVDSPRTKAAMGWVGVYGPQELGNVTFKLKTKFATVCVQSLDGAPIREAKRLLVTVGARVLSKEGRMPFYSEPVEGEIAIKTSATALKMAGLGPDGSKRDEKTLAARGGVITVPLSRADRTHWFVLEA
ncbi:MAG: glycosyl hydrolase family 5 [Armatimonadota bacterium]